MVNQYKIMINELSKEIHSNNKAKGFYDNDKPIPEILCLIHSEVSEALEAHRKDRHCILDKEAILALTEVPDESFFKTEFENEIKDTFEDELADSMIRLMDLAGYKGIDLDAHIKAKLRYNTTRPYKHGKKY